MRRLYLNLALNLISARVYGQNIARIDNLKNEISKGAEENSDGRGIHQKVIDKIFQPFFTNKPTGQGTVLGLSYAYDIITKDKVG